MVSRRVVRGGGTRSERGATNPLGSVRVYGARSCVRIMATPDPVDPATLEIKTRSIEQTLLPLVKQVRQLIGKRREGTLVCSNHFCLSALFIPFEPLTHAPWPLSRDRLVFLPPALPTIRYPFSVALCITYRINPVCVCVLCVSRVYPLCLFARVYKCTRVCRPRSRCMCVLHIPWRKREEPC